MSEEEGDDRRVRKKIDPNRKPIWVGSYARVMDALKKRSPEQWKKWHPAIWYEWKSQAANENHRIYAAFGGNDPPEMGYPSMAFWCLQIDTVAALDQLTGRGPKMTPLDVQGLIENRRRVAEYQKAGAPFTLEDVFRRLGMKIPGERANRMEEEEGEE